ncbi:transcription factor KUA1-like [Vicia villosa]|uniref:transcription factor KUA1-like n=1 Tax=Vicia villosa TaxID=3911 RepID=UPI00273B7C82|nr:transcription factor KUA1-like [Vicia villosa]
MEVPSYLYLYPIQEDEDDLPPPIPPFNNVENKILSPKNKSAKKIQHWNAKEHRLFLEGLERYGKGNWKKISKHVVTKSSTQVASHAQKYFIRNQQNNDLSNKKKERRSQFDNIPSFYGKFYPVEFFNFIQRQPFIDEFLQNPHQQVKE